MVRRRTKGRGVILLVVTSDDHPNSMVGLCPSEGVERDTGGVYLPSKAQNWLMECWRDLWGRVAKQKRALRAEVVWVHCGDGVDDNTHSKHGLITVNKSEMVTIGYSVKKVGLEVADRFFYVRGTEAHVGQAAELEELVARLCGAERDPLHPTNFTRWYWRLELSGVRLFFRHRPDSNSTRFYTRGGGANRTAAQLEMAAVRFWGGELPHAAYFGHVHHMEDSGGNYPVRTFFCPPFCLRGDYAAAMFYAEPIGARLAICSGGSFQPLPAQEWIYQPTEGEWVT